MRIRSAAVVFGLITALGTVLHAQDAQPPAFRAGVEALPIDVVVVDDRGQPIRDLIAADFTIRIDGRQRRIISTQWVSAAVVGKTTSAAPSVPEGFVSNESSTGGRLMALVIDQPNIPFGDIRPLRDAMNAFVDRLSLSDRLAVIGLGQPSVTTPFLADKAQLKDAIAKIPGQKLSPGTSQHDISVTTAFAIADGDENQIDVLAGRDCPGPRQAKPYLICREEIRGDAISLADQTRQTGMMTLTNLRELLTSLKAIDGPKTVIYVSQGFFLDRARGDEIGRVNELANMAAASRTTIYSLRMEDSIDLTRSKMQATTADDMMVQRYGLETLTLGAGGTLLNLAGTGAAAFDRLSSELSGYYLIGVEADARDRDGKPHPVKVDIGRQNVTVRVRRTMMAGTDTTAPATARSPQQIVTAAISSPLPASGLPIRAAAYAFRGLEPSKVRLLIHAEIGTGYTAPQRLPLAYYVVDKDGKSVDGQLTDVRLAPAANGVPSALIFTGGASVDPGEYLVKIAVADGDRVGSVDLPVRASLLDLGRVRLTDLLAGGPPPPINLLRPSVDARISFGTLHGYLEAYGPDAATLGVRFEIAADERGPAILATDVRGVIVGEERVVFTQTMLVSPLPPGPYRLRAMILQGNTLLTTLSRSFEIGPLANPGAKTIETVVAAAPGAPLFLPVESRELARAFDRDAALKPETLAPFQSRVPATVRAAFDEGVAHLQKREYRDAETSFKKAITPEADSSAALTYLGVTYAAAGRDTQATGAWRTAMTGADDVPQLYEWLGEALLRQRSSGEARPVLEEAATRFPDDERFARPLALLYATFGKGIDAVKLLEKSIEKRPGDQMSLFLAVEWIFNAHRAGAVVHDRTEDLRLAHEYAAQYLKAGGLNEPLVKQWLNYLDKEPQ
jgi:VWFA-related protein